MRLSRLSMALGFAGTFALAAQLLGCGGDDDAAPGGGSSGTPGATSSSSGATSSSSSGSTPLVDAGPPGPTVTVSDSRAKIYLGQKAVVDAAVAPGSTAWTVIAAPYQSTITTESLQDASTATPSFTPDLLGSYTLQATGGDGTVLVIIEAIDAPIFWRSLSLNAAQSTLDYTTSTHVGGAYTSQQTTVGCPIETTDAGSSYQLGVVGVVFGAAAADVWEAPAGTPSRLAFPELSQVGEAAARASIGVATSASTCGSPDAKSIVPLLSDAGEAAPAAIAAVRFSPNGTRLAYAHDDAQKHAVVSTVAFDGSDERVLAAYFSAEDGGLDGDAGPVTQTRTTTARWQDDTHVGWISFRAGTQSAWDLYVAEDVAGAVPTLAMHCTDSQLYGFDFLPDGRIVASTKIPATDADDGDTMSMNLVIYTANATTKECEIARNVTGHTRSDAVARGFSISPDKKYIAFLDGTGSGEFNPSGGDDNQLGVFWVPVDGSSPYTPVPGAAQAGVQLAGGTRWSAGGTVLSWSENGESTEIGGGGRIVALPLGGSRHVVKEGTQTSTVDDAGTQHIEIELVQAAGQGCSTSGEVPFGTLALGSAVGVLGLVLRRKRST